MYVYIYIIYIYVYICMKADIHAKRYIYLCAYFTHLFNYIFTLKVAMNLYVVS